MKRQTFVGIYIVNIYHFLFINAHKLDSGFDQRWLRRMAALVQNH